ncbi:MAG TPA: hypothetical protein VGS08_03495 [Candidatus Saccharimonadales bacterium]|nr:hypothetical protein [Candidatus Saccharimonadales bacterium]
MPKQKITTRHKEPKSSVPSVTTNNVPAKSSGSNRRLKLPSYRSFHLQPRIRQSPVVLSGAVRLFARTTALLVRRWKLFGGMLLWYLILGVVIVQGISLHGSTGSVGSSISSLFTATTTGATGGYQLLGILLVSLAFIWCLREVYSNHPVRIRDGFYQGMGPLIPFTLVLIVVGLELLPAVIGVSVYTVIIGNGIAALLVEKILWAAVMGVLLLLSCYMVSSSVFALYIVTLPGMTPIKALRSARQLVRNRRWLIMRKLLFMPFAVALVVVIVMVPFVLLLNRVSAFVFLLLETAAIGLVHSYMYGLYRELLNE